LKHIDLPQSARIEIGKTTKHHKNGKIFYAEINLELPHRLLRATVEAEDLYEAIDRVKEELEREILRYVGGAKATRLKSQRKSKELTHSI
jgi:ribosomal subunit interface protein